MLVGDAVPTEGVSVIVPYTSDQVTLNVTLVTSGPTGLDVTADTLRLEPLLPPTPCCT